MHDDELDFFDDDDCSDTISDEKWEVFVVDDDEAVHQVTKLTLNNYIACGRKLHFTDAYSAKQAIELLPEDSKFIIILLDVIMEHDHAGLEVVKYIREKLCDKKVKIVLRTGQPGALSEQDVSNNYDIDLIADKASLTADKLQLIITQMIESYLNEQ